MRDWKKAVVGPTASIKDTIKSINDSVLQIALVVDEKGIFCGTVTDGDIRAGILRGVTLDAEVSTIMHQQPIVAKPQDDRDAILSSLKTNKIHHMPIVDADGRLVGLETLDDLLMPMPRSNAVVLMAGGLGTRLRPLTDDRPKPLLHIGNRPILETIIMNFIEYGFSRFYLSVNYKAEMVMDYFGDGSRLNANITYLHEKERMGTAGALSLIPDALSESFLVMNADLLTKVNFSSLLNYHVKHNAKATMCVREFDYQVPYGVVKLIDHRLVAIEEKPIQRYFVNAGIYALEPDVLPLVPKNAYFDMPQLFDQLIKNRNEVAVFPVQEYWMDIGRLDDYQRAAIDFSGEF